MNKKILVIFLFAVIIIIFMYKHISNDKYILIVGEENIEIKNDKYKVNSFLYDNITYKELVKSIKNNDYSIIKNKKVYLNELIYKSDYIFITANKKYCEEKGMMNNRKIEELNNLINYIKRIAIGKIVIIKYCDNVIIDKNIKVISSSDVNDLLDNT